MRLVVTGGSGFIGRNVLLRVPREWDVTAVYHTASNFEASPGVSHVRCLRCNLADESEVRRLGDQLDGRPDVALYLAANGDPAASVDRPRWDLESSVVGIINFLEHCAPRRLVYVSSGAVYDGAMGPVTPATPVSPRLPYAIAKLAAEQYVRFFAERRRSLDSYANVRLFGAYGPYEPARKITSRWIRAVMNGDREFTIRGDGENLIDFMYVDDAVDGLVALISASGFSGALDFGAGAPATVNQIVEAMARASRPLRLRHEGLTAEHNLFRTVDPTMREQFGIAPRIVFDDGFRRLFGFLSAETASARESTRSAQA